MDFFSVFLESNDQNVQRVKGDGGFTLSHQMLAEQKATQGQSSMEVQDLEPGLQLQLQQALAQISQISSALCDIQLHYQDQVCVSHK